MGSSESPRRTFENLRTRSLKGVLWTGFESVGIAALSLGVFVVMARVLEAQDFGVVALAGVFVYSFSLIVGSSFADAIVQRTDLKAEHADAAFWATVALALTLTGLCHAGADVAARLFHEPRLAEVLPWLAWMMPLSAIGAVQTALFRRALRFRTVAIWSAVGRITGAAVGVGMALSGFGIWSLVGQQLVGVFITGLGTASVSAWRPRLRFSFSRLREMWTFGFHVSASHTVNGMAEQAVNLLVGSLFGATVLGYFNVAWRMIQLVCSLTGSAVYHVGFSAFSRLQQDRAATARAALQATRMSCLFGFPMSAGIAVMAGPIIVFLFGQKWDESVPLLALLAIEIIPTFYAMFFSACYRAMGRPEWAFGLAVLYATTSVAAILLLAPLGIWAVAAAWVGRSFLLLPLPMLLLGRVLDISMSDVLAPALVPGIATAVMSAVVAAFVWSAGGVIGNTGLLLIAILIGVVVYVAMVALLKPELLRSATGAVKTMITPARLEGAA